MSVLTDLEHRTGVGAGGVALYVLAAAAGVALAGIYGDFDYVGGPRSPLVFVAGLVYALGLLGVVAAVCNVPRVLRLAVDHRGGLGEGRTAATGVVETTSGTLASPFHDEPAVCYTYRVLENDRDEDPDPEDESNWTLVDRGDAGTDFSLVTDRGERVHVDSTDASKHFSDTGEVSVGADEDPPAGVRAFCRERDVPPAGDDAARRYQESTLEPGDGAFVWGRAVLAGRLSIGSGSPFVVADSDYPARVRDRVTAGLVLGVPVTLLGLGALLFVAGAF